MISHHLPEECILEDNAKHNTVCHLAQHWKGPPYTAYILGDQGISDSYTGTLKTQTKIQKSSINLWRYVVKERERYVCTVRIFNVRCEKTCLTDNKK